MSVRHSGTALALALALAGPALAAPSSEQAAAAAEAERRGLAMRAHDQAAASATERFRADAAKAGGLEALRKKGLRGYVIEPFLRSQEVVFYGEKDGRLFALARYSRADGKVTGGLLKAGEADELSPLAQRMVAALAKTREAMAKPGHEVCSKSPPNSIVLPQGEGLSVYVLTSTTDPKVYPAGGHYRFDFDAEGELVGERRFMTGCLPIDLAKVPTGKRPTLLLSHVLDPQPTEIHSFVSQNVPLNLAVVTAPNRYLWTVRDGKIAFLDDKPPPGIPASAFEAKPGGAATDQAPEEEKAGGDAKVESEPVVDVPAPEVESRGENEKPADQFKVDPSKLPPPEELPPGR